MAEKDIMQVMKLLVERRIDRDIGGVASWSDEQCDRVARVLRVRGHHISDCKERQRGYILSLVMILMLECGTDWRRFFDKLMGS